MKLKLTLPICLLTCLITLPALGMADTCQTIKGDENSGLLLQTDAATCINNIWQKLQASNRFPTVFPELQAPNLYSGVCFASSPDGVHATLGEREVVVNSISAWTKDYKPFLLARYFGPEFTESMASVISQWTVIDVARNRVLGKIFTADAIDLNMSSEFDVIVGGSDRFLGARGSVRIDSSLNADGTVNLTNIKGTVCTPI